MAVFRAEAGGGVWGMLPGVGGHWFPWKLGHDSQHHPRPCVPRGQPWRPPMDKPRGDGDGGTGRRSPPPSGQHSQSFVGALTLLHPQVPHPQASAYHVPCPLGAGFPGPHWTKFPEGRDGAVPAPGSAYSSTPAQHRHTRKFFFLSWNFETSDSPYHRRKWNFVELPHTFIALLWL